jgi:type I site-specific restriction-modification system R (restriction) subunit
MPFQALQIIFEMQSTGTGQKKVVKKICFFKKKKFFILTPPIFKPHNFLIHFKQFKVL